MRLRVGVTALVFLAGGMLPAIAQETVEPDTDLEAEAELDCELDPLDPFAELPEGCEEEEPELEVRRWRQYETATLRGLDKITGRSTDLEMRVGETRIFGALEVNLQVCFQTPPDFPPESAAFLQIDTVRPAGMDPEAEHDGQVFSGWMFASSPGLNALEHPVYDIWVIRCARPEIEAVPPTEDEG